MKWSAVLGFALICSAHAGTILFDNSNPAISAGNRAIGLVAEYQSFSNGAGNFSLTDVQVVLTGANPSTNVFSVGLYANNGNTPGGLLAVLGTMMDNQLTASCTCLYDFPVSPIALTANTRYWIGISTTPGPNASTTNWSIEPTFISHPSDVGVAGEFIDDSGIVSADSSEAFQMKITVSPTATAPPSVPEPSTMLLGAAGFAGLLLRRIRQATIKQH